MIYITGDCHGDFSRFGSKIFYEQKDMTKNDYIIICGDFGGIWDRNESGEFEAKLLDELESKPFTTLFVDGNHENFDRLYQYPVEEWNGGKVHKIRSSVIHLMRGQVFTIEGKKIFSFGGARSHDMEWILDMDTLDYLEKKKELDEEGRLYRINHVDWWNEELPAEAEMEVGRRNLEAHDYKVDFVVTHCHATSVQYFMNTHYKPDILTDYFEELREKLKYTRWFCGHYHRNKAITHKDIVIYEQIIRIC